MARKIAKARNAKAGEELPPKRFVFFMLTLLVIWLVVSSMIYVWIQMETIQTGYKLVQAHKKQEVLLDVQKRLQVEWNYQHSPERLADLAKEYGFHPPGKKERIVLSTVE